MKRLPERLSDPQLQLFDRGRDGLARFTAARRTDPPPGARARRSAPLIRHRTRSRRWQDRRGAANQGTQQTGPGGSRRRNFASQRVRQCAVHGGRASGPVLGGKTHRTLFIWRMVLRPHPGHGFEERLSSQAAIQRWPRNRSSASAWRANLVAAKIRNQRTLLRRNHLEPPPIALGQLKRYAEAALQAEDLGELLGIEGNAARDLFRQFQRLAETRR